MLDLEVQIRRCHPKLERINDLKLIGYMKIENGGGAAEEDEE